MRSILIIWLILFCGITAAFPSALSAEEKRIAEALCCVDIATIPPSKRHQVRSIAWMDYYCLKTLRSLGLSREGILQFDRYITAWNAANPGAPALLCYQSGLRWLFLGVVSQRSYMSKTQYSYKLKIICKAATELETLQ